MGEPSEPALLPTLLDSCSGAHPHPRQGEVTPDEFYDDAVTQAQENREDYAETLQVLVDATDEDALLLALSTAADQREQAERLIRELLAYGRHNPVRLQLASPRQRRPLVLRHRQASGQRRRQCRSSRRPRGSQHRTGTRLRCR